MKISLYCLCLVCGVSVAFAHPYLRCNMTDSPHAPPRVGYRILTSDISGARASGFVADPPPNDAFAARIRIAGTEGTTEGTTTDATLEPNEPRYVTMAGDNTVWWTWTAPTTEYYSFDTVGSDCRTVLAIWNGATLDTLRLIRGSVYFTPAVASQCVFLAHEGLTYHIQVHGESPDEHGRVVLTWSRVTWDSLEESRDTWNAVKIAPTGALLQQDVVRRRITGEGRNFVGTPINYIYEDNSYGAITVVDARGNERVNRYAIPALPMDSWVHDFDGKHILIATGDVGARTWLRAGRSTLLVYVVKKNAVEFVGRHDIPNYTQDAWLTPRGVCIWLWNNNDQSGLELWRTDFQRKRWEIPMRNGHLAAVHPNGSASMLSFHGPQMHLRHYRRGRQRGILVFTPPAGVPLHLAIDQRLQTLSWMPRPGEPASFSAHRANGREIFTDFTPPDFNEVLFDGRQLWFRSGAFGGDATLRTYSIRKTPQLQGEVAVSRYEQGGLRRRGSYAMIDEMRTLQSYNRRLRPGWYRYYGLYRLLAFFPNDIHVEYSLIMSTETYYIFKRNNNRWRHYFQPPPLPPAP